MKLKTYAWMPFIFCAMQAWVFKLWSSGTQCLVTFHTNVLHGMEGDKNHNPQSTY